ncbi:neutral sphingomyelinase activation associated factor-like BEACH domain-containing protein [Cryptosporidium canis]|nr:neutral sphingomyelinase activation associated factor-like BEACH domain-containing protein [Cryptosporidium canis]
MALNGVRQFSHLTLEENEEYITDVSCVCRGTNIQRSYGNLFKARIRIGSKSIIVEPDDSTMSMIKILFSQIVDLSLDFSRSRMAVFSKIVRLVDVQVIDGKSRSVTPNEVLYSKESGDGRSNRGLFELEITISNDVGQQLMTMSNELWQEHSKKQGAPSRLDGLVGKWISFLYNKEILNVEYEFLLDHRDQFLISKPLIVNRIKPFTKHRGILHIVSSGVCFKPLPNFSNKPYKRIPLKNIWFIFKRIYSMKPNSVEIIYGKDSKSHILAGKGRPHWRTLLLEFQSTQDREHIVAFLQSYLMSLNSKGCQWSSQVPQYASCLCSSANASSCLPMLFVDPLYASQSPCFKNHVQNLWISGSISTYHYLDYLNSIGGRSKGDLTQYPVFPWTIVNFSSDLGSKQDISQPSNYRDLSKPLGSINQSNLEMLKSRMKDLPISEQFLYGSHYSTPGYISYFLVRQFPEYQLKLHGGDFDVWNRMFHSMSDTWRTILEGKTTYMELIPQFYEQNPDFLLNNKLNIRTNSGSLLNVQIPKWEFETEDSQSASTSLSTSHPSQTEMFLRSMRYALEGKVVSQHIHEWIDLIFGFKQRGAQAYSSDNLFHPITYINSSIAMTADQSPVYASQEYINEISGAPYQEPFIRRALQDDENTALRAQVEEFGQVPIMLFNEPHPKRDLASQEESTIMEHLEHRCANMPWFVLFKSNPQLLEARYDFNKKGDHIPEAPSSPMDMRSHLVPISALSDEPSNSSNIKDMLKKVTGSQESILRSNYKLSKAEFDGNREDFALDESNGFMLVFKDFRSGFRGLDLSAIDQTQETDSSRAHASALMSIYERPGEFVLIAVFGQEDERLSFYISIHGFEELGFRCIYSSRQDTFGNQAISIDLLVCDEGSTYLTIGTLSGDLIYIRFKLSGQLSPLNLANSSTESLQKMFVMAQKEKVLKQFNLGSVGLLASTGSQQQECYIMAVSQGGTLLASKHSTSEQDFRRSTWFPIVDIPIRNERVDSILGMEMISDARGQSRDEPKKHTGQQSASGGESKFGKITKDIDSNGFSFSCILSDMESKKQRLWGFSGQSKLLCLDLTEMLSGIFSVQGGNRKENGGSGNDIIGNDTSSHGYGLKEIEESQRVDWIFLHEKSLVLYVGFHRQANLSVLVFWDIHKKEDAKVHRVIFVSNLCVDSVCWDKYRKGLLVLGHQASDPCPEPGLQAPPRSRADPDKSAKMEGEHTSKNIYFLPEKQWAPKSNNALQTLTLRSSFELLINTKTFGTSSSERYPPEIRRPTIACTEKFILLSSYLASVVFRVSKKNRPVESSEQTS